MSGSTMRSSRPASVACQSSSPRLLSPLNPAPRNSPIDEMSDTLSPLRECLDSGSVISPRTSPALGRPRASSFSRSPEPSPVTPLQQHRVYAHRSSPGGSPFSQGIPFPTSSPLSSPPLAGQPQSTMPQNQRSLSPSNSSRPGSPASIHSTLSQFQARSLRSPTSPRVQSSPVQMISPCLDARTQSLIQRSFENPYVGHIPTSLADNTHKRRISLGAETRPGDSTPLNEAPIRWWGRRTGWADDWGIVTQKSRGTDAYTAPFTGQLNGTMHVGFVPGYESPSTFREPFGHDGSPGAFLDEEIHASFDGQGIDARFAEPPSPPLVCAPMGINTSPRMDNVSQAVPIPIAFGASRTRKLEGTLGYGGLEVGSPPVDGGFLTQTPHDSTHHRSRVHLHGNTDGGTLDSPMPQGHDSRYAGRGRRFSDASTHSSASYASCVSGPSQSQSQSLLVSPSQSHTSACPSLSSLGIGIEEAEREVLRSRSIWRRRNSGSTTKRHCRGLSNSLNRDVGQGCRCSRSAREDVPEGERMRHVKTSDTTERIGAVSKQLVTQDKDTPRHGSIFSRVGSKPGDVLDEQVQRDGYTTAEKYVSLAVTSILPVATITRLSPFGEALVKARNSAKYLGHELGPLLKDTLSVSTEVLAFAPLPGLEEAAKALLCVWDACQKVDTNRLACLRLAERCATLLYSVRCEINEAGAETALGLAEPVEKLCGALVQIRSFLETQLHRPFLKRYVKREEIARELQACNEAITDAGSRFGISVQIRTYQEVVSMMNESKRWFSQEAQALVLLDHQMMQRYCATMYGPQVPETAGFSSGNTSSLLNADRDIGEGYNGDRGSYLSPLPAHGPSSSFTRTRFGAVSGTPSIISTELSSDRTDFALPATPTPTRTTFIAEETKTKTTVTPTRLTCPMQALAQVHRAQDTIDAAADEAALQGTLAGALNVQNDVELVRCLQVSRGEIPEAAETLRRILGTTSEGNGGENKRVAPGDGEHGAGKAHTELDRKFMESGIKAMTRLTSVAAKEHVDLEGHTEELPCWTITRYEVVRTRKIAVGFFSDVYLGHWRKLDVVIKVLSHSVSREVFVRLVELWNKLDHPNVLPLYGASSAVGEKPWFFVSKFCSRGSLLESLKQARLAATAASGSEVRLDLLKCMCEIAKGMAYLHGCGILHGDLKAANVLVDESGQCLVSDFGQSEVKLEARRSCGQPPSSSVLWRAPEMLMDKDQQTCAADVYAFAMCCVEILGMGDSPWATFDDNTIRELVLDKDARPTIPVHFVYAETATTSAVTDLIQSCWARAPEHRPTFTSIVSSLEEIWRVHEHDSARIRCPSTPVVNIAFVPVTPTESSPGDERYETASESMTTEVEEECMADVPLTSPLPNLVQAEVARSMVYIDHSEAILMQESSSVLEHRETNRHAPNTNMNCEANYRVTIGRNHPFHSSLTLPLWSPTRVELGAVGYLSKLKGEFVTLFNAMDPFQSDEERLRRLPSMHGYGKFEVHKREDGKRSVAQRGLDAISGFLTFKTRSDRLHPERIARQYTFPVVQGTPSANLCVEKTVHRYMDRLEAPKMWLRQHADLVFEVLSSRHAIHKEDLILVVGTLDAPDWAMFVSDDHPDGRVQFSVFSGREKGEPWGMFTMERAITSVANGPARWLDMSHGTMTSKVSCITLGSHDAVGDAVMLAGLGFGCEEELPTMI